ncbi:MAG: hypothetical protein IJX48_01875 [Paludibacteraceae bacterium]|nr:hypothetical protein [Paludibacteraceae bacterium]
MRKFYILLVLVVVAGAMTSCLEYKEPQYSPQIYRSEFYVNPQFQGDTVVGAKDTLDLIYDADDDSYELDTVYLGDTVMFASTFYTVTNNLVAVEMKWDTTEMDLWYLTTADIDKALLKTDTVGNLTCTMRFNPGYNRVTFPIYFTPKERGGMKLKLSVESDSDFPIHSVLMYIPAVEAPVETEE